jgi:outer membrane receptor protein involved in Fe transport
MKKIMLCFLLSMAAWAAIAQQFTVSGKVKSKNSNEPVPKVSIAVKGSSIGTVTDEDGRFELILSSLPVTLVVSSVGFQTREIEVLSKEGLGIELEPASRIEQEYVLSPTRGPVKFIESPVTVQRYGVGQIRNMAATSYYGIAGNKNGVDLTTSSLTFTTISTRGFNGSGSTRVNQLVDGMDNQAPGLNFFVGNFAGLTELDVDNVEILNGASSALYGPGGMNGTVLINSKSPFKYQGLSVQVKEGLNNVDNRQRPTATAFHDFSLRWAKAFNERVAVKIGAQYISGTDWLAADSSNYSRSGTVGRVIPGNRSIDPNYDGVNVYGDETSLDLRHISSGGQTMDLWSLVGAGIKQQAPPLSQGIDAVIALTPSILNISRTGYNEKDVVDPETRNIKLSGALHYKISRNTEAQLMGYWATGNSVYTGNNRYALKDIKIGQYKLELKNPDWFLRSFTTQENAGHAYSATVATQYFNEAWRPSGIWYQQYAQGYLIPAATLWLQTANTQGVAAANAAVLANAQMFHASGRSNADVDRPLPGSAQFKHLFDSVRRVPIPNGGLFLEKSQLWMTEGQYNLKRFIKFAEVIVGANWKKYILDSKGTLFIDTLSPIGINEVGAYAQATKRLFSDRLVLSFSGRYDKNEDFKGRFTPRATMVFGIAKNNNLRFSYQTAYRFPSTQQKYIRLNVGDYTLLGGLPWVMSYLDAKNGPVVEIINGLPSSTPYVYKEFKPESMRSFELGYKGMIAEKLLIDAYGYWGQYRDFLGRNALYQLSTGKIFSTVVNSSTRVRTHGFGLGFDYQLPAHYSLFFNVYSDVITDVPSGFQAYFNTPKYRLNAGFANPGLGRKKLFGFNAVLHWQDAFMWDGELANGPVAAYATIDAQVNYKIPKIHTMIKVGGTNVFNKYYKNGYANPEIGGLYYVSIGYNL